MIAESTRPATVDDLEILDDRRYRVLWAGGTPWGCMVFAPAGVTGLVAGEDYLDTPIVVGAEEFGWEEALMTIPFNVIGRVPVLNLPTGRAANGIPTGLQIIGPTYADDVVFRLGAGLEAVLPSWADAAWRPGL